MPQISVITNQPAPQDTVSLRKQLSSNLAEWLNKPEAYCMVHTQFESGLSFGGTEEPAASVELASLGLSELQPAQLAPIICNFLHRELGIEPSRIYIRFDSPARTHWGWDSKTFG
jgi:phenylpyruvate tautomerase PptA (4-oxalocrotonate tautomerase family)